ARPLVAVPDGVPRPAGRPEGRAVVGVEPPAPPSLLRPSRGHPQSDPARFLVEPHRLDPLARPGRTRLLARAGPREVPRARLARPPRVPSHHFIRPGALPRLRLDGAPPPILPLARVPLPRPLPPPPPPPPPPSPPP